MLCSQEKPEIVFDCWTSRASAIQTHHFATIVCLAIEFEKIQKCRTIRKDLSALRCTKMQDTFTAQLKEVVVGQCTVLTLDAHSQIILDAFGKAATCLPDMQAVPKRPWVSAKILQLIAERNYMRRHHNYVEEKYLSKLIRASAKNDKQIFLHEELTNGNWNVVK